MKRKQGVTEMKMSFIGSGKVGSTAAFAALLKFDIDEMVMFDIIENLAKGEALDLGHAAVGLGKKTKIIGTSDYTDTKNSDIFVISAGFPRAVDTKDRLELTEKNASIIRDVCKNIKRITKKDATFIVITNPVDAMTYTAYKSGLPKQRCIGMGGSLDTHRHTFYSGARSAKIIGEHGEGMIVLGTGEKNRTALERTRNAGRELIQLKGYTNFGPAAAIAEIIDAVINNRKAELVVSAVLDGEFGISGVAMQVPCIIGRNGIEKIDEKSLSNENKKELKGLAKKAADALKNI